MGNSQGDEQQQILNAFTKDQAQILLKADQQIKAELKEYLDKQKVTKDEIFALKQYILVNQEDILNPNQNEKNKQIKIFLEEQQINTKIKNLIKEYFDFDSEIPKSGFIGKLQQQQQNIDNFKQTIELLNSNVNKLFWRMQGMENSKETSSIQQNNKDLEKQMNDKLESLEKLQRNIDQNINAQQNELKQKQEEFVSIKTDLSNIKNILDETQKKQEEFVSIKTDLSNLKNIINETQKKQEDIIERFFKLERNNEEKTSKINQILVDQNTKVLQIEDVLNNKIFNQLQSITSQRQQSENLLELQFQKQLDEINNKLQVLETEINSMKTQIDKIKCADQKPIQNNELFKPVKLEIKQQNQNTSSPNFTIQNSEPKFNQIQQNPITQQQQIQSFPQGAQTLQNINKKNQPNNAQQNNNVFQSIEVQQQGKQNFNQGINPNQQQQQQVQFAQCQTNQNTLSKQSQIQFKNANNQIQPMQFNSQIKIPSNQNQPIQLIQNQQKTQQLQIQQKMQLIQFDSNRCKISQSIINKIYNETTRQRSVQGNYLNFIREVEDFHQLQKNYGIKQMTSKQKLKEICNAYREVRGDGNCFYTAFGFQVIQIIIGEYSDQEFQNFINELDGKFKCQIQLQNEIIRNDDFHNSIYTEFLFRLQQFRCIENKEDRINQFIQHFQAYEEIPNSGIDGCLYGLSTIFFRNLAYYLVQNSDQKTFIDDQSALLKWETECNSNEIVISLLANYLNIKIQLLFFENGNFQLREYNENSNQSILLLIQPGHYNIGLKQQS